MADSALPALLSLTSHELRGPTGVVRGYLRLLEQDPVLPERIRRTVAQASDASNRLLELLEELSELGRFKSGSIHLSPKSVSLRSILAQAVQSVALPNPDVTLDVIAEEDVRVGADEARLRFVFATLIVALARAQNGVVTLELRLVQPRRASAAPHVIVAIHSLGRGAVSERPVDLTRGGIGLSLAIADAIVTAHGGRLRERWLAGRWVGFAVRM